MASAEMQLVCKIIKTGELKRVIEWGINEEDFLMLETKAIFQQLLATFTASDTSGSVIGPRLAQQKFTQLNLDDIDEHVTIEHLCTEVRSRRLSKIIKEQAQAAIEIADVNPLEGLTLMQHGVGEILRLDAGKNTDIDFSSGMRMVAAQYALAMNGEAEGKIPWPWGPVQEETMGVQEDDFIVFYGRPKSMKSWVLAFLIAWAVEASWLMRDADDQPTNGKRFPRVLVYTKEMTPKNVYQRIAACLAGLPYSDLRKGKLTPDQYDTLMFWVDYAEKLAGQNRLIVLSGKDVAGRDTVTWLRSKIDKYAPDICFIDGLYLMSPENPKIVKDNERVASISRSTRQMILDTKVPVIATMQANRKAAQHGRAELDEIAFSDAVAQDCTIAARTINDKMSPTISVIVGGSREFFMPGFRIKGIPAVDFSFDTILTESDILEAKQFDSPEDEKNGKKKKMNGGPRFSQQNGEKPKTEEQKRADKAYQAGLDSAFSPS